jgi:diamine N-acetyltransferase
MNNVRFRRITVHNFKTVIRLSDTLDAYQRTCVADNVRSIAEAYLHRGSAWPRAIYAGNEPVGFLMLDRDDSGYPAEERPVLYLWRFMIAGPHQGKGYGRAALDLLMEKCRKEGVRTLYLSCETDGEMPYAFYRHYGFEDTNRREDGEEVLRMTVR